MSHEADPRTASEAEVGPHRGVEPPSAAPEAPAGTPMAALLSLQRTAGNRAARRLAATVLARQTGTAPAPAPVPAPAPAPAGPTAVSNAISDPRTPGLAAYGWTAAYDVQFVNAECRVTMKVQIVPDAGVPAADATRVQNVTRTEFQRIWDKRFILTDAKDSKQYVLRIDLSYVTTGAHQVIALHPGKGRNDLGNWFVDSEPITRAHEMGHALGIKDEYIDATAVNRASATSPGVFKDNSIMGDYYREGRAQAEAKTRHAAVMAGHIGTATTKTLTAGRPLVDVMVKSTEDWTGADEVYVRVTGPGGVAKTPVKSLNDNQLFTFPLSLAPFGNLDKPVTIDVFDEDWPDADDLIVRMVWSPPFNTITNKESYDEADYKVTARLG